VRRGKEAAEAFYTQNEPEPQEGDQPPAPEAQGEQPPAPQQETPPPPPAGDRPRDWERDYRAMEGRFREATRENANLSSRIEQLEANLDQLMRAPPSPAPAPQRLVTDEEEQEFGTDLLNVVGKRAEEAMSPKLTAMEQALEQLKGTIKSQDETIKARARSDFYRDLDRIMPEWRGINRSEEFKEWCGIVDPYARQQRGKLLLDAFNGLDAQGVLNFFKGFIDEAAVTDPRGNPAAPSPSGKVPLDTFAAPGRARPAAVIETPVEKPIYTHAQIASFYADVRTGKWKGRDADRLALEADIYAAQHEGRIQ
jgi:cell division protein FtsB